MTKQDIEQIHERLPQMTFNQQLAFFWFMGQRLYPNYLAFHKKTHWGNPEVLQQAAAFFAEAIPTGIEQKTGKSSLYQALANTAPDIDDFDDFTASLALDACAVWQEGLGFIEDKDTSHLIDVSASAVDLAQMHIELQEEKNHDDYAFEKPPLQEEIRFQQEIISALGAQNPVSESFLYNTTFTYSHLGATWAHIPLEELLPPKKSYHWQTLTFPVGDDLQSWLADKNITIDELVPELLQNFYQTFKKVL